MRLVTAATTAAAVVVISYEMDLGRIALGAFGVFLILYGALLNAIQRR
jgi:hypothetical protein